MLKQGDKLPCSAEELLNTLASHTDSERRNLLHEAMLVALENESRYFISLIKIGFPMYGEDADFDFAAYYICNTDND